MDGKEEDEKGYKGSLACISNVITVIPITTITSAALHCNSHCPRIPSCNLHPASPSLCWPRHPPTTRHPSPLSHAPKPLQTHFRPPTTQNHHLTQHPSRMCKWETMQYRCKHSVMEVHPLNRCGKQQAICPHVEGKYVMTLYQEDHDCPRCSIAAGKEPTEAFR